MKPITHVTDRVSEGIQDTGRKIRQVRSGLANRVSETARDTSSKTKATARAAAGKAKNLTRRGRTIATKATTRAREGAKGMAEQGLEAASDAVARSYDIAQPAVDAVTKSTSRLQEVSGTGVRRFSRAGRSVYAKASRRTRVAQSRAAVLAEQAAAAASAGAARAGATVGGSTRNAFESVSDAVARSYDIAQPAVDAVTKSTSRLQEVSGTGVRRFSRAGRSVYAKASRRTRVAQSRAAVLAEQAAAAASAGAARAGATVGGSTRNAFESVSDAVARSYGFIQPVSKKSADYLRASVRHVESAGQGLLAGALAVDVNAMLADLSKGAATVYDQAMDAEYLATHVGGGLHRLFDGGHTLWGAFQAVKDAPGEDGLVGRALGMTLGLFRDVTTPSGLPFFTWDPETYSEVADALQNSFGIPKAWFFDLLNYDAAEVLAGLIGSVSLAFRWNRADAKEFARIAGSTGLASVASANPILAVVTVAALAKAFSETHGNGAYGEAVRGLVQGAAGTGASMAAVSLVGATGGPAGVALIAGIVAGVGVAHLTEKAGEKIDVIEISDYLGKASVSAAAKARVLLEEQLGRLERGTAGTA